MVKVDYRQSLKNADVNNDFVVNELCGSLTNGYIDKNKKVDITNDQLLPRLLNNKDKNTYKRIVRELQTCKTYIFAVAFVNDSMITNLKPYFIELAKKGIKGRILTSTYLYFNQPKAFSELLKIPNVEVKIANVSSFHQKGYIFQHQGYQTIIIGSANLTDSGLMHNYEWSLQINSLDNGDIVDQVSSNVETEWENAKYLTPEWIKNYEVKYHEKSKQAYKLVQGYYNDLDTSKEITPNSMQKDALFQLKELRRQGKKRGLVISATGTGKTYLAAFDVKATKPKKMLFLAHREQILKQAKESFLKIIGGSPKDYGLYTGDSKNTNARYVFATVQTLSKKENLNLFDQAEFDYILIDEVHHAGAQTYQMIMDHFKPKFYLGMTATPERNDSFNVFKLFDYNIAYEIRLPQALAEKMLCPFHYFGISDYVFKDNQINDVITKYNNKKSNHNNEELIKKAVAKLSSRERVKYILKQSDYYGYSGDVLHGLVFCSSVYEAISLAYELTRQGYPAKALSGDDSGKKRNEVVADLEKGTIKYIVTVDIFNEGIDIPCVNQVILLRNTNSSIIYTQQLGRGLRKFEGKEYVVIIDFIGNYKNNYIVPISLTDDNSYSKDNARATVNIEPIIGTSTIYFDPIAKEKIFASIRENKFDSMQNLRIAYKDIKKRVGRMPLLQDFIKFNSVDPIILANKEKNYAHFLAKVGEKVELNDYENKVLTFLDAELLNGKRKHELILLDYLSNTSKITADKFKSILSKNNCITDPTVMESVKRVLDLSFYNENAAPTPKSYGGQAIVKWDAHQKCYLLNEKIQKALHDNSTFDKLWRDSIKAGLMRSHKYQADQLFTIGEKYTRKDVMRQSNNQKNITAQNIGGYYFNDQYGMIFVTYKKAKDISESINYDDQFINEHILKYYSKNNRKITSKEVEKFFDNKHQLLLFVKRSDADDNKEFYYLGSCECDKSSAQEEKKDKKPIVSMQLQLKQRVKHDLYQFLTDN